MATDTRHLTRRHGRKGETGATTWYAVQAVPRPLQAVLGKRHLLKSLGTSDLAVARARRHGALAEFQAILDQARRKAGAEPVMGAAMRYRESMDRLARGDLSGFSIHPAPPPGTDMRSLAANVLEEAIEQSADEIADQHSPAMAKAFLGVATGTATPLTFHIDSWLREGGNKGPVNARTQAQYRSAVKQFADWCQEVGIPPTVEAITKATAGKYVTEAFVAQNADPATTNRHITSLSSYWRWMIKRTGIELNPWAGQSRPKANRRNGEKPKRAFTDAEVLTLLNGDADQELADAIRVAALSGMRLEEIYRLTVADCQDGAFDLRRSKTPAGVRVLPIHSELAGIVARRMDGREADDFLFPEAGPQKEGRERSMAVSKRFGHYRQRLGVEDREEGRRHSRIDFHSFRRWFITKARNAGIDRAVVAAVVGHEAGNLTDDTYSAGPSMELKRKCVEAVKLPNAAKQMAELTAQESM